jgi:HSP20 family protein
MVEPPQRAQAGRRADAGYEKSVLAWPVAFARWDPLQDLLALHERLNRLAGDNAPGWVPPVDLYETADHYVISVELPGLSREDFQIGVQDGKVVLKGQRPPRHAENEQFHRVERGHGQFSRSFALPQPIDETSIAADLRDGVLTVTIPKLAQRPRRIEVR